MSTNSFEVWNPASYVEIAERSLKQETREKLTGEVSRTLLGELTSRYLTREVTSEILTPKAEFPARYQGGTKGDIWEMVASRVKEAARQDPLNLLMMEVGNSMLRADSEAIQRLDKTTLNTLIQQVTGLLLKRIIESSAA
jgi:hypothetical protein